MTQDILTVLRTTAKANSYDELEAAIRYPFFRAASIEMLQARQEARKRAAERKEPRRWTPSEEETLRRELTARASIGEIAQLLSRTPRVVADRAVVLGLLNLSSLRPTLPVAKPIENVSPLPTPLPVSAPLPREDTEDGTTSIGSVDSEEDDMMTAYYQSLSNQEVERNGSSED